MSKSGGGGGGTNTVQKADPWPGVQPYLLGGPGIPGLYPGAAELMKNPPQYYPDSTVAPQSPFTLAAIDLLGLRGLSGSPLTDAAQNQAYQTMMGGYLGSNPADQLLMNFMGGGFGGGSSMAFGGGGGTATDRSRGTWEGQDMLRSFGAGALNTPTNYLEALAQQSGSPDIPFWMQGAQGQYTNPALQNYNPLLNATNARAQYLQPFAEGAYVNQNPWLDQMMNAASSGVTRNFTNAVAPSIASQFALGGRGGTNYAAANQFDTAERALGDTLSNLSANIYGTDYQNQRQMQLGAAGQLGQLGQGEMGLRLGATQGLAQGTAQDIQNLLASISGLGGAYRGNFQNQLGAAQGLNAAQQADAAKRLAAATGMSQAETSRWVAQMQAEAASAASGSRADTARMQAQLEAMKMLSGNYQFERGMQQQAMGQAPGLAGVDYTDISQLGMAGSMQDAYSQQQLNDMINRFNFYENQPANMLGTYGNLLQGFGGGTTTTSQQSQMGLPGFLGTGLMGASLYNQTGGLSSGLFGGIQDLMLGSTLGASAPTLGIGEVLAGLAGAAGGVPFLF